MEALKSLKVLYVEDDSVTREEMAHFLKRRVGKVFLADNGENGIEQFKLYRPEIVLADLLMPGINGIEMLREIKKIEPQCAVIITTTVSQLDTVLEAVDLGIDQYIIKPVEPTKLEEKLNAVAEELSQRKRREAGAMSFDLFLNKAELEDIIKKELIKVLKGSLGKGPREATVFLAGNRVEITVWGADTTMEKTMVRESRNVSLMEQYKRMFYETIAPELEALVENITTVPVSLQKAEVNSKKAVDKLLLKIEEA